MPRDWISVRDRRHSTGNATGAPLRCAPGVARIRARSSRISLGCGTSVRDAPELPGVTHGSAVGYRLPPLRGSLNLTEVSDSWARL